MTYFEQRLPIALIFGSFFAIFVPLLLLQLLAPEASWLPAVLMVQAVGLGTSHFFVTLALYLQSANLDYFRSSARNRVRSAARCVTNAPNDSANGVSG